MGCTTCNRQGSQALARIVTRLTLNGWIRDRNSQKGPNQSVGASGHQILVPGHWSEADTEWVGLYLLAFVIDHDIVWFDIAMHDILVVCVIKGGQ